VYRRLAFAGVSKRSGVLDVRAGAKMGPDLLRREGFKVRPGVGCGQIVSWLARLVQVVLVSAPGLLVRRSTHIHPADRSARLGADKVERHAITHEVVTAFEPDLAACSVEDLDRSERPRSMVRSILIKDQILVDALAGKSETIEEVLAVHARRDDNTIREPGTSGTLIREAEPPYVPDTR